MGGMIAQTLAARQPELVSSLTSIMSSTGGRFVGQPALKVYPIFLRRAPEQRAAFVEHAVNLFTKIGSSGLPVEETDIRELAELSYDRDRDRSGSGRQLAAIVSSGDRTSELRRIQVPTLVIHGGSDPLISVSGARATARAIQGARLMIIKGMGHDLPRAIWPQLVDAILANASSSCGVPRSVSLRDPGLPVR
jgi:pimeloyl-ACP methyl ester carboxylesterase